MQCFSTPLGATFGAGRWGLRLPSALSRGLRGVAGEVRGEVAALSSGLGIGPLEHPFWSSWVPDRGVGPGRPVVVPEAVCSSLVGRLQVDIVTRIPRSDPARPNVPEELPFDPAGQGVAH